MLSLLEHGLFITAKSGLGWHFMKLKIPNYIQGEKERERESYLTSTG